jgi:hypothetical protein
VRNVELRSNSLVRWSVAAFVATALAAPGHVAISAETPPPAITIKLPGNAGAVLSGRVIVFFQPANGRSADVGAAGWEIHDEQPGTTLSLPTTAAHYPAGFPALRPGLYSAVAMLDVNHTFAYFEEPYGGYASESQPVVIKEGRPVSLSFVLDKHVDLPTKPADTAVVKHVNFVSPALSAFWKRPIEMHATVLLPPAYATDTSSRFPTLYIIDGFGAGPIVSERTIKVWQTALERAQTPFILVWLDPSFPSGHHVFADSANNGPWGRALTEEFIPSLESAFRMSATPATRLLTGHSSGGWSSLWLQITYPTFFGGTWSTSPDPVDFHDFTGPDLTAAPSNMYHDANGAEYGLIRIRGTNVMTLRQYVELETAEGPSGGQFESFDAVFSPRGPDGAPEPVFDRAGGAVDPAVAAYWEEHYDIAHVLRANWPALAPLLAGKIHVLVGSEDTFHLERPV